MTPPDLASDEGRAAYRAELRAYLLPWRVGGLAMVLAGAGLMLADRTAGPAWSWAERPAWFILFVGWAVLAVVIFKRSAYHRRRISSL